MIETVGVDGSDVASLAIPRHAYISFDVDERYLPSAPG